MSSHLLCHDIFTQWPMCWADTMRLFSCAQMNSEGKEDGNELILYYTGVIVLLMEFYSPQHHYVDIANLIL